MYPELRAIPDRLGPACVTAICAGVGTSEGDVILIFAAAPFTDATTGIKMFRKEIFASLNLESRPVGWTVAFEMAIKAHHAGLRLGEVPIVSIDRLYGGESTFRLGPWMVEYSRWFLWGLRAHLKNRSVLGKATVRIPKFYR